MARTPQFKVALEPNLRDALEAAAARSGRTLAAEIRARLEGVAGQSGDPITQDLQAKIAALAEEVELETGAPMARPSGLVCRFRVMVWLKLLARRKGDDTVPSPTAFGDRPHQTMAGSPEEIGHQSWSFASQRSGLQKIDAHFGAVWRMHGANSWPFSSARKRGETNKGK